MFVYFRFIPDLTKKFFSCGIMSSAPNQIDYRDVSSHTNFDTFALLSPIIQISPNPISLCLPLNMSLEVRNCPGGGRGGSNSNLVS